MQELSTGKFHGDPTSLRTPAVIATGGSIQYRFIVEFLPAAGTTAAFDFRDWRHVPNVTPIAKHWIAM
jgi:hypothetical protein